MNTMLLIILLIAFFAYLSRVEGLWGQGKAVKKANKDIKEIRAYQKRQERMYKVLSICEWFANNYGIKPTKYQIDEMQYKIERLKLKIKTLNRTIKPIELVGLIKIISLALAFTGFSSLIMTGNMLTLVLLMGIFLNKFVNTIMQVTIQERDRKLEEDFPLLFMMLYPRLLKGTHGRISPILREYLDITGTAKARKNKKILREYVEDLEMKINIYNDDTTALIKNREVYNSAMIVNFTNLGVQALRGVDNSDRLVTFKIELQNKENELMENKARAIVRKAEIVVWSIFIILVQVVIVTYSSKLSFLM